MTRRRHSMPFGAEVAADGVNFNFYAPDAGNVALLIEGRPPVPMVVDGPWRRAHVSDARPGDDYRLRLPDGLLVPDPASRHQPNGVCGPSRIVDPCAYQWRDDGWRGRPWSEAVLYEAHVGSATPQGTYAAFAKRLDALCDLGVTAVELMPLSQWRGDRNWGYDGVLPFAPSCCYGTPDDLKELVDRAHALGIMIIIDVVYNHFGPSGNYLNNYASSFFTVRHETPWGASINFDDEGREATRAFFVHNALYWLREFNVDGLRLDAVHSIQDDSELHILREISQQVRTAFRDRHIHLILENDRNEAHWLVRRGDGVSPSIYTSQWNDDVHHCWHTLLTGERDGYYADFSENAAARLARGLAEGFVYQGDVSAFRDGVIRGEPSDHLHPAAFIDFLQNHDQIGNRAFGERIDVLADRRRVDVARTALLLSAHVPMLFMGEEWGAREPFLYFVDFEEEPDLARAVRDGRRREFAGFADFAEAGGKVMPDPNALATFERSRLRGDGGADPGHVSALKRTRSLLCLRRNHIVPLLSSPFAGAHYSAEASLVDVTWRFASGVLRLLINLGAADAEINTHSHVIFHISDGVQRIGGGARLEPWSIVALRRDP